MDRQEKTHPKVRERAVLIEGGKVGDEDTRLPAQWGGGEARISCLFFII